MQHPSPGCLGLHLVPGNKVTVKIPGMPKDGMVNVYYELDHALFFQYTCFISVQESLSEN